MTSHRIGSIPLTITHPLARTISYTLAGVGCRLRRLQDRLKVQAERSARRDAVADEFRRREERRRLWMR
jgi:hypothetical protein